ncbi:MAG: hypothetical protein HY537_07450, partial [Deltaproteobacteria bacterium]|nr:hypothetical protein [Deltaproteobacteria bacterium]
PGPSVRNLIQPHGKTYYELFIDLTDTNISRLAKILAMRTGTEGDIEKRLLQTTGSRISLNQFLPEGVRSKLGTTDNNPCYSAAFTFHNPNYQFSPDFMTYLRQNYYPLGYQQDKLQFGDLIVMWRKPPGENHFTHHVALYLGGDFIFHKYGPMKLAAYEFHTWESLTSYYKLAMSLALQTFQVSAGNFAYDFQFEYMRYDPDLSADPLKVHAVQRSILNHRCCGR